MKDFFDPSSPIHTKNLNMSNYIQDRGIIMIAIDHVSTGTEKENENETSRCVIIKCIWCVGYKCIASNAFPCNFKDTNELEIFENVWKTPVKGEKGR